MTSLSRFNQLLKHKIRELMKLYTISMRFTMALFHSSSPSFSGLNKMFLMLTKQIIDAPTVEANISKQ